MDNTLTNDLSAGSIPTEHAPSDAPVQPARTRQANLARMLGVSRQAIHRMVRRGVLKPDEDGLIDIAAARLAILEHIHPEAKSAASIQARAPAAAPAPSASSYLIGGEASSYHVAKTMREAAEAQIATLKLAEMQGELIRVQAVRSVMATIFATVREAILQMPARMAPLLAAESDAAAVQQLLHAELHAALQALANAPAAIDKVACVAPTDQTAPPLGDGEGPAP